MKEPTRREIIYLSMAVRDAYMGFDQDDYCDMAHELFEKNRMCDCFGCVQYKNLARAYKIAKKYLPNPAKTLN